MENRKIYKISVIGDDGVGKKTFLNKYGLQGVQTIGLDVYQKNINFENTSWIINIWVIPQNHRYGSIKDLHQGSKCAILMYDICKAESFINLHKYITEFTEVNQGKFLNFVVIGNKNDKRDETCLPVDDGIKFAKELSDWLGREVPYYDVSVLNDDLEFIFLDIIKGIQSLEKLY
ncbi:MAG: hypothetical protein OEZ01_07935 [Candidatus Heimdallarchaeota archaeon]|nr:hypothetical protein [Candidatus Heimdallarchaeota archaeon]MDH5645922.1 hypothetical protein [Candidatus Heimdallarchaeota archaeon]